MKWFMLRLLAITLLAVAAFFLRGFFILLAGEAETEHEKWQYIISLCVNSLAMLVLATGMVVLHVYGVTTRLKITFLTMPLWYCVAHWLNSYNAHIFHYTLLALDVNIALSTPEDGVVMISLSILVMLVTTCAVTLDVIDDSLNGDLHIHFWGREGDRDYFVEWMSYVAPMVVTFTLLKSYVTAAREQELRAVHAVEMAYKISDHLANYDLDAADKLLRNNDAQSLDTSINIKEPLAQLLANLRSYSPFLPHSLFSGEHMPGQASEHEPNKRLRELMNGKEASLSHVDIAVQRIRDPEYCLTDFHRDMVAAYPELQLYADDENTTSGTKGAVEYQRTLGALYAVYSLLRLDMDGKEVFSFGIDEAGCPRREPVGDDAAKRQKFHQNMRWEDASELVKRAGILIQDDDGKVHVRKDRLSAMLALTAIHDIMKNTSLTPTVQARHAPYRGYASNEQIGDHDVALEYVLEHFPTVLPSFKALEPGQRVPILFTQGKMGFNNGWLVQGEAPPGALFARFKQVIMEGRASQSDINFYFLHWLTDLAGAEPFDDKPWPGAEKFTTKFPVAVLSAFLDSWGFVERLALGTEVEVMEDYLVSCWKKFGPPPFELPTQFEVAAMRLALMAQGFEKEIVAAFSSLNEKDREVLAEELSRTGRREQFQRAPASVQSNICGPALLVYYAPALVQKAKAEQGVAALHLLAAVFRSARCLFPLGTARIEESVIIRIDELKVLTPSEIEGAAPWHLQLTSGMDAEARRGSPPDCNCVEILFSGQEPELTQPEAPALVLEKRHSGFRGAGGAGGGGGEKGGGTAQPIAASREEKPAPEEKLQGAPDPLPAPIQRSSHTTSKFNHPEQSTVIDEAQTRSGPCVSLSSCWLAFPDRSHG